MLKLDLQYCVDNLSDDHNGPHHLMKRAKECPATWGKYNKISNVLNNNVSYNVYYQGDDVFKKRNAVRATCWTTGFTRRFVTTIKSRTFQP